MPQIFINWKNSAFDIDIALTSSLGDLKARIYSITNVLPERQKILGLKVVQQDQDLSLSELGIKDKMKLWLIGTPVGDEINLEYNEAANCRESSITLAEKHPIREPAGMFNVYGSTCYLNSVIQFLRPVKELTEAVKNFPEGKSILDAKDRLAAGLKDLLIARERSDISHNAVSPTIFVETLMECVPQFAEMDNAREAYAQQDPEEFLSALLEILSQKLPYNIVDSLFKFEIESTISPIDHGNETTVTQEVGRILPCYVGTFSIPVNFWYEGIRMAFRSTLTKASSTGQEELYEKILRLNSLPPYLIIHTLRFEWKKGSEINRTKAGRAKVSRRVVFDQKIDLYEFCSDAVKQQLDPFRQMKVVQGKSSDDKETCNGDDGTYTLQAIITHMGRSADSGHYIAWIKTEQEEWYQLNDAEASRIDLKNYDLWGGRADYHIATLTLYKKTVIEYSKSRN